MARASGAPGRILVTGGAGYIGSHVVRSLLLAGHAVDVLDDLSTGDQACLGYFERIGGPNFGFHQGDIRDAHTVQRVLSLGAPQTIIHLAGLKDVAGSFDAPELFHDVNVVGTKCLLTAAELHGVKRFVFSSSAAVYGEPGPSPLRECDVTIPSSPYGQTKLAAETLVTTWSERAPKNRRAIILRYFNPCGRHPDFGPRKALAGTQVLSLAEAVLAVAAAERPYVTVYGNGHGSHDGTCLRDFVHISDIVSAHLAATCRNATALAQTETLNIGSGLSYSVLEFISTFERISNIAIPLRVGPPRQGDAAVSCAEISLARMRLNWQPAKGLDDICRDLAFSLKACTGYEDKWDLSPHRNQGAAGESLMSTRCN